MRMVCRAGFCASGSGWQIEDTAVCPSGSEPVLKLERHCLAEESGKKIPDNAGRMEAEALVLCDR
jgi:hypothetical protein